MYSPFKAVIMHVITNDLFYRPIEDIPVPVNVMTETVRPKGMKLKCWITSNLFLCSFVKMLLSNFF